MERLIVVIGDTGSHGGSVIESGTDESVFAEGKIVCVEGAIYDCPIHGQQPVNENLATKTTVNSKNVVLHQSKAACGAEIYSSLIKTFGS
mgnify:CR=1 FL=1